MNQPPHPERKEKRNQLEKLRTRRKVARIKEKKPVVQKAKEEQPEVKQQGKATAVSYMELKEPPLYSR